MVDTKANLTLAEIEQFARYINEKAVDPEDRCTHCNSTQQGVATSVHKIDVGYGPNDPGTHMPLGVTVCQNCGLVRLFHFAAVGIDLPDARWEKAEGDGAGEAVNG